MYKKTKIIPILIFIIVLFIPSILATLDATINLKACYDWEINSSDRHGQFSGIVTSAKHDPNYGPGFGGGAYHFDGTDDHIAIDTPRSKDFNFFLDMTILICFNTTNTGTGQLISNGETPPNNGIEIKVYGDAPLGSLRVEAPATATNIQSSTVFSDGLIHCLVYVHDGTGNTGTMYVDKILNFSGTVDTTDIESLTWLGERPAGPNDYTGTLGPVIIWENETYTQGEVEEITDIVTGGALCNDLTPAPPAPTPGRFSIYAIDEYDSTTLNNFTVTLINNTASITNTTTLGNITYTNIINGIFNISFTLVNDSGGYYDINFTDYNISIDLTASLTKYFRGFINISGFIPISSVNYTRNLTYEINLTCPSFSETKIIRYINNSFNKEILLTCTDNYQLLTDHYINSEEGNYTITLFLNTSFRTKENKIIFNNGTYLSDLNNPSITLLNFTIPDGFGDPKTNITLECSDNNFINISYNLTFNGINLFFGNLVNGTYTNETNLIFGDNTALGVCSDLFGSTDETTIRTIFVNTLFLIDEVDNTLFNLDNVTGARVYFDNNRTFYDFKVTNTSFINFTTEVENQLRFELKYSDGTIITRYVDVSFINGDIRVCANKEGTEHFQQLMIAATAKPVIIKNIFSNCVIAADRTRFAYQDALVLQAFSIPALYSLYTINALGQQIFLASMDGSISTFTNVDTLEFGLTPYNLNILKEALTFEKVADEIKIFYQNLLNDSTSLTVTITRLDNNDIVFTEDSFTDPNAFTLFFDYSTLSNVTNQTLFQVELLKTGPLGQSTLKKYFNVNGSSGILFPFLAATIAIFLTIFGLTFTATKITFGWFGIIIQLAAIAVLSAAASNFYILMLQAIEVIILIFIVLMLNQKNISTIS